MTTAQSAQPIMQMPCERHLSNRASFLPYENSASPCSLLVLLMLLHLL